MIPPDEIPRLANAEWLLQAPTQRVLQLLADGGYEGRPVGGVVRNSLLGLPVTDIDIATTALPRDVIGLARAAGLHVIETGIDHGTVTVLVDHHPFEVTTLRRDVATDGRRATVAFTDDWAEDARRRDFTINALYCDADGNVLDPLGGYPDIVARRVRFVGDPVARIKEDYLRILRFFRFSAQYGSGPLDRDGLLACTRGREGILALSGERIRQEMLRLIVAQRAVDHIEAMQAHGILAFVLRVAPRPGLLARVTAIETSHGLAGDAVLRLGALAIETPEDAGRVAASLKLSREERDVLNLAVSPAVRIDKAPGEKDAKRLLYRLGPASYRRVVALSWARQLNAGIPDRDWDDALSLSARWQAPRLPVNGNDVMACGVAAGARVGDVLRAVERWWIERNFEPDRAALLEQVKMLA